MCDAPLTWQNDFQEALIYDILRGAQSISRRVLCSVLRGVVDEAPNNKFGPFRLSTYLRATAEFEGDVLETADDDDDGDLVPV